MKLQYIKLNKPAIKTIELLAETHILAKVVNPTKQQAIALKLRIDILETSGLLSDSIRNIIYGCK